MKTFRRFDLPTNTTPSPSIENILMDIDFSGCVIQNGPLS